jgi:hypothetical protein
MSRWLAAVLVTAALVAAPAAAVGSAPPQPLAGQAGTVGASTTTATAAASPPVLTVKNESDTGQRIPNATARVSFVGEDLVKTEPANANGNISLDGSPSERPAIVELSAPGYHDRTYYFDSFDPQQPVYLLPTNVSTSTVVYQLDDQTGVFDPPQNTALFIRKPVQTQGLGTKYVTVVSDRFGATGERVARLETGERYRLQVRAPSGEVRSIGNYQAAGDDPNARLRIGTVKLRGNTSSGVAFAARVTEQGGSRVIKYRYTDPAAQTEALFVTIYETGNQSNLLLPASLAAGGRGTPVEQVTESVIIPASAPDDVAYTVEFNADRGNGTTAGPSGTRRVGDVPEIAQQLGLAPNVLSMLGWGLLLGSIGLVVLVDVGVSLVVGAGMATMLTWVGALAIPAPLLGIAGGIAVLTNFAQRQP